MSFKINYIQNPRMITKPQILYVEQLCIDCCLTREGRNFLLTGLTGRHIDYIDELTLAEAHVVIEKLKEIKENG